MSEQVKETLPVRAMLVLDAQGRASFRSDMSSLGIDYSDRDYFQDAKGFGNPEEWLDRVHPEDRDRVKAAGQASLEEGNDRYQYEVRMRHADGTYRWVSTSGRPAGLPS